ncbi:hypothetical protein BC828DRAFT_437039 [Blastocladiella britannica]|nr:hypothetical protein BC828DRAFT_437039 [Blastocladiella britannica]
MSSLLARARRRSGQSDSSPLQPKSSAPTGTGDGAGTAAAATDASERPRSGTANSSSSRSSSPSLIHSISGALRHAHNQHQRHGTADSSPSSTSPLKSALARTMGEVPSSSTPVLSAASSGSQPLGQQLLVRVRYDEADITTTLAVDRASVTVAHFLEMVYTKLRVGGHSLLAKEAYIFVAENCPIDPTIHRLVAEHDFVRLVPAGVMPMCSLVTRQAYERVSGEPSLIKSISASTTQSAASVATRMSQLRKGTGTSSLPAFLNTGSEAPMSRSRASTMTHGSQSQSLPSSPLVESPGSANTPTSVYLPLKVDIPSTSDLEADVMSSVSSLSQNSLAERNSTFRESSTADEQKSSPSLTRHPARNSGSMDPLPSSSHSISSLSNGAAPAMPSPLSRPGRFGIPDDEYAASASAGELPHPSTLPNGNPTMASLRQEFRRSHSIRSSHRTTDPSSSGGGASAATSGASALPRSGSAPHTPIVKVHVSTECTTNIQISANMTLGQLIERSLGKLRRLAGSAPPAEMVELVVLEDGAALGAHSGNNTLLDDLEYFYQCRSSGVDPVLRLLVNGAPSGGSVLGGASSMAATGASRRSSLATVSTIDHESIFSLIEAYRTDGTPGGTTGVISLKPLAAVTNSPSALSGLSNGALSRKSTVKSNRRRSSGGPTLLGSAPQLHVTTSHLGMASASASAGGSHSAVLSTGPRFVRLELPKGINSNVAVAHDTTARVLLEKAAQKLQRALGVHVEHTDLELILEPHIPTAVKSAPPAALPAATQQSGPFNAAAAAVQPGTPQSAPAGPTPARRSVPPAMVLTDIPEVQHAAPNHVITFRVECITSALKMLPDVSFDEYEAAGPAYFTFRRATDTMSRFSIEAAAAAAVDGSGTNISGGGHNAGVANPRSVNVRVLLPRGAITNVRVSAVSTTTFLLHRGVEKLRSMLGESIAATGFQVLVERPNAQPVPLAADALLVTAVPEIAAVLSGQEDDLGDSVAFIIRGKDDMYPVTPGLAPPVVTATPASPLGSGPSANALSLGSTGASGGPTVKFSPGNDERRVSISALLQRRQRLITPDDIFRDMQMFDGPHSERRSSYLPPSQLGNTCGATPNAVVIPPSPIITTPPSSSSAATKSGSAASPSFLRRASLAVNSAVTSSVIAPSSQQSGNRPESSIVSSPTVASRSMESDRSNTFGSQLAPGDELPSPRKRVRPAALSFSDQSGPPKIVVCILFPVSTTASREWLRSSQIFTSDENIASIKATLWSLASSQSPASALAMTSVHAHDHFLCYKHPVLHAIVHIPDESLTLRQVAMLGNVRGGGELLLRALPMPVATPEQRFEEKQRTDMVARLLQHGQHYLYSASLPQPVINGPSPPPGATTGGLLTDDREQIRKKLNNVRLSVKGTLPVDRLVTTPPIPYLAAKLRKKTRIPIRLHFENAAIVRTVSCDVGDRVSSVTLRIVAKYALAESSSASTATADQFREELMQHLTSGDMLRAPDTGSGESSAQSADEDGSHALDENGTAAGNGNGNGNAATEVTARRFALKLQGRPEYLHPDHALIDHAAIRHSLARGEKIDLVITHMPPNTSLPGVRSDLSWTIRRLEDERTTDILSSYAGSDLFAEEGNPSPGKHAELTLRGRDRAGVKLLSMWDLSMNLRVEITRAEKLVVPPGLDSLFVEAKIMFGGKALCAPVRTRHVEASADPLWLNFIIFDIPIYSLPRNARMTVTIYGNPTAPKRRGSDHERAAKHIPIGTVSLLLVDNRGYFRQGSYTCRLWEGKDASDMGPCTSPCKVGSPMVQVRFEEYTHPVVFPDQTDHTLLENTDYDKLISAAREDICADDMKVLEDVLQWDPLAPLSDSVRKIVWTHRVFLLSVPESLPKVLVSSNCDHLEDVIETRRLLNIWRPISVETALLLLDGYFADDDVRDFAVCALETLSDDALSDYVMQLVQALSFEHHPDSSLARFLLRRALLSPRIGHIFYWSVKAEMDNAAMIPLYLVLLDAYLRGIQPDIMDLVYQQQLVDRLNEAAWAVKQPGIRDRRDTLISRLKGAPVIQGQRLPLRHDMHVSSISLEKCKVMDSKKLPLWIAFKTAPAPNARPLDLLTDNRTAFQGWSLPPPTPTSSSPNSAQLPLSSTSVAPAATTTLASGSSVSPPSSGLESPRGLPAPFSPLVPPAAAPAAAADLLVIYKAGDDLRQDALTLQMLRIMDRLWRNEGLDLRMTLYGCMSTGRDSGFIEVVPHSATVSSIQLASGGSTAAFKEEPLEKWIRAHNPSEVDYDRAVNNFTLSCAGYCVATFCLGIGDRHNDNIMVTQTGRLFHIDFGHFLGNIKRKFGIKRERAPFVLTPDFVHVISKKNPANFDTFVATAVRAYLVLRRNANVFMNLFLLMLSTGIPELQTADDIAYLRDAFCLGLSESEAAEEFQNLIFESLRLGWSTQLNWWVHNLAHLK